MTKKRIVFYTDSPSWKIPALCALIVFALSAIFKYHFYYIHLYLTAASVISLLISYRKYAEVTDNSITIFIGRIFRQKLNIKFGQIDSIKSETKDIKGFARLGPSGAVPYNFKIELILFNLLTPLRNEMCCISNGKKINIFNRTLEVTKDGKSIILYKPPRGGFRPLLNSLSNYVSASGKEKRDGLA